MADMETQNVNLEQENIVPDVINKKVQITNKLQKRDEDRRVELERKREEKEAKSAKNESADFFASTFDELRSKIERDLDQSESIEKGKLQEHFDLLLLAVQKLQKITTDSAMFLPAYDVQRSNNTIADLQKSIQDKRDILIPRKKFAFKSKKKATTQQPQETERKVDPKKEIKVDITDCSFADMSSQNLIKKSEETNNNDVALARLKDCNVKIYGYPRAVHIDNLENCKVFTGPISGSIFIENCKNCTFVLACQQLRIHHSTQTDFYIHVTSKAIIEYCNNVHFAPYNWVYQGIDAHYKASGLDKSRNSWDDVDDFNWLAADAHSPNWDVLDESKRVESWEE